jgi:hypothetical protein
MTAVSAANTSALPIPSTGRLGPFGTLRRMIAPQTAATSPAGTFTQKIHCQPAVAAISPPRVGPASCATDRVPM